MTVMGLSFNQQLTPGKQVMKSELKGGTTFKELLLQQNGASQSKGLSSSLMSTQTQEETDSLLLEIEDLLSQLSTADGFLEKEMLDHEGVAMLLQQLPVQVQNEIEAFFQKGISVEDLLERTGDKRILLFTLVTLEQSEKLPFGVDKAPVLNSLNLKEPVASFEEAFKIYMKKSDLPVEISTYSKNVLPDILQPFMEKIATVIENDQEPFHKLRVVLSQLEKLKGSENFPYPKVVDQIAELLVKKGTGQEATAEKLFSAIGNKDIAEALDSKLENFFSNQNNNLFKQQAPMSRIEQYVIHINQSGSDQEVQTGLLKQFQSIIKKGSFQFNNGNREMLIKLHPEHLGSLTVKLSQGLNGEMIAKIIASTAKAKDLIESNLYQLKNVLQSQQVNLEKLEVSVEQSPYEQQSNGKEKRQNDDEQSSTKKDEAEDDDQSFLQTFQEELLNLTI